MKIKKTLELTKVKLKKGIQNKCGYTYRFTMVEQYIYNDVVLQLNFSLCGQDGTLNKSYDKK